MHRIQLYMLPFYVFKGSTLPRMCKYTGGGGGVRRQDYLSLFGHQAHTLANNVQYVPLKSAGLYLVQELKSSCMHIHILLTSKYYTQSCRAQAAYIFPQPVNKRGNYFKFKIALH